MCQCQQWPHLIIATKGANAHVAHEPMYKPMQAHDPLWICLFFPHRQRANSHYVVGRVGFINQFACHMLISPFFGMVGWAIVDYVSAKTVHHRSLTCARFANSKVAVAGMLGSNILVMAVSPCSHHVHARACRISECRGSKQ